MVTIVIFFHPSLIEVAVYKWMHIFKRRMFVDDTKAKFYLFDQVKNLTNNEGKSVGKI